MNSIRAGFRQLSLYGLSGVLATSVHYIIMALMMSIALTPVLASTAGAIPGALVAYAANRKWTFKAEHTRKRLLKFILVAILGLVLNGVLLATIHQWLIGSIMAAQLVTTGLVFVTTYFVNLKWSFA